MAIHSGYMWIYPLIAWWFSTIMLVYQRVPDCSPQDLIWLDPNGSTAASRQLRSTAGSFLCAKPWGQNQAMRETCAGIDHQILRPSWESHPLRLEIMKRWISHQLVACFKHINLPLESSSNHGQWSHQPCRRACDLTGPSWFGRVPGYLAKAETSGGGLHCTLMNMVRQCPVP